MTTTRTFSRPGKRCRWRRKLGSERLSTTSKTLWFFGSTRLVAYPRLQMQGHHLITLPGVLQDPAAGRLDRDTLVLAMVQREHGL